MNLEQDWKELPQAGDSDLEALLQPGRIRRLHSHHPLRKIRQLLLYSLIYALLISGFYLVVMALYPAWPVVVCLLIVLTFNAWVIRGAWLLYRDMDASVNSDMPLLTELERHRDALLNWMNLQLRAARYIYPVATTGGFMLGGMLGSEKPLSEFMSKPVVLIALGVTLLVLVPAFIWLAKWMFRKSFGRHLTALEENIRRLRADE